MMTRHTIQQRTYRTVQKSLLALVLFCLLWLIPSSDAHAAISTAYNTFPYGQCTWWANARYHQLHHVYVSWHGNAWLWPARAYQYGWKVSRRPSVGAILVLQPWVQGAYGLGHVAVVERINRDGSFVASNMNWGKNRRAVVSVRFRPGPGVSFVQR